MIVGERSLFCYGPFHKGKTVSNTVDLALSGYPFMLPKGLMNKAWSMNQEYQHHLGIY